MKINELTSVSHLKIKASKIDFSDSFSDAIVLLPFHIMKKDYDVYWEVFNPLYRVLLKPYLIDDIVGRIVCEDY